MMTRLRLTLVAIDQGTYDYTAVVGLLVAVAGLIVDAAAQAKTLPPVVQPVVVALAPWAHLVALVGTGIASQGKSLLVRGDA
jgi:hypothetical protein